MATMSVINQTYNIYRDRYFRLLARGADDPRAGFQKDLDYARMRIDSVADAFKVFRSSPEKLNDIVVNVGLELKPIFDQIETRFPPGTKVVPGSSVHSPGRLPESTQPKLSPEHLAEEAPEGIGRERGAELLINVPWYFWKGVDLRVVLGVAGGALLVTYFMKRR